MTEKSVIVCYSYSGHTYRAAKELQRQTGADLYELYPRQPYPMETDALNKQVKKEINTNFFPKYFPLDIPLEQYKVVFLGTPNWFGTIAPVLRTWLFQNQKALCGKILFPFCTQEEKQKEGLEIKLQKICSRWEVGKGLYIGKGEADSSDGKDLSVLIHSWLMEVGYQEKERKVRA